MSLLEQQNFLARLYTSDDLRRRFLSEPEKTGLDYHLSPHEISELVKIIPGELNFFAESLFWKRLREVKKLLPLSSRALKDDFTFHFRAFSQDYNPQSVKKHLDDAFEFSGFLLLTGISETAENTVKYERAKLKFFGFGKKLVICRLRFDVREISRKDFREPSEKMRKLSFAVWLRAGKQIRHFVI